MHVNELAQMVGTGTPERPYSAGGRMLRHAAETIDEEIELLTEDADEAWAFRRIRMAMKDVMQDVPSAYTHEIWETFVDLAAYHWQTEEEPPVEMTAHAEHVLYEICEALGHALLNYYEKENNE